MQEPIRISIPLPPPAQTPKTVIKAVISTTMQNRILKICTLSLESPTMFAVSLCESGVQISKSQIIPNTYPGINAVMACFHASMPSVLVLTP